MALGVATVSVTCWFIVQGKLYEQVDNDLQRGMRGPPGAIFNALNYCSVTPGQH